jgi:hypothetical protein
MNPPALSLNASSIDKKIGAIIDQFFLTSTGAQAAEFPVHVELSVDENSKTLEVEFELSNDKYLEQNNYIDDNSALWNQEVFEMFISPGADTPERYIEVQLNPNGALFSAWVTNPNGAGTENAVELFDGSSAGIKVSVVKQRDSWRGKILFPLSIFGTVQDQYRLNLFRIVSLQDQEASKKWSCTATSCAFLAWSPTFSGAAPAFHVPEYFGHLYLK